MPSRFAGRPRTSPAISCSRCEHEQAGGVGGELGALQGLERRGDGARHVGECETDGLGSEIDADQAAARREPSLEVVDIAGRRARRIALAMAGHERHMSAVASVRAPYTSAGLPSLEFIPVRLATPMKITWFGHSCFRVETGKSIVLIDPFLKGNPTFEALGHRLG